MPLQGWNQLLNSGAPWQTTVGSPLSTASTATISSQAAGSKDYVVGTQYLYPGAVFRLTAQGIVTITSAVTTTMWVPFPAAGVTPAALCTPVTFTNGGGGAAQAVTGLPWWWQSVHRITAIGSTGNTISSMGWLSIGVGAGSIAQPASPANPGTNVGSIYFAPASGGENAAAIDTSVAMPIMMRCTLTGTSGTVQCLQFLVEQLD
jgi:hypothetical protein